MRPRFAALTGLLCAWVAACSSFDAEETPSTLDAATGQDGAAGDAGATDANAEGAAVDAADAADPAPPFCTTFMTAPLLCLDFEDGNPPTTHFPTATGDLALVPSPVFAGTGALRARGMMGAGSVAGRSLAEKRLISQTLSFRVRASSAPAPYRVTAARLAIEPNLACNFELRLTPTQATLYMSTDSAASSTERPILGHPGPDKWFEMRLELATVPAGGFVNVRVKIDGVEGLTPVEVASSCEVARLDGGLPRVELGVQSTDAPTELHFDNVVFDGK